MNGAIAYDLTRIFLGPLFPTPRGIDRVDFVLARHLLRCTHRTFLGILPTPWGIRVYDADLVERVLQRLEELWAETKDPRDDPAYGRVVSALTGQRKKETEITRNRLSPLHKGRRMAHLVSYTGFSVGRSAIFSVPKNSIYVNVGHYGLAIPAFMSWLGKRRDVKPILMLHDTIPLDRPELVSPQGVRHHRRMVRSVARFGAGLIVTTGHARETILQALAAEGRSNIKTLGIALPLAEAFDSPAKADPLLERVPYFVVCGTVEPRKNHLLLLEVWRQLSALPARAPHLVVIGSLGWRGGSILDQMLRCETTHGQIHHVQGLSTQAMKSLIIGSRGLLSPSFAEGFGLPIIEALHLGAPVLASDIPAHREVAGQNAILLDPLDSPAWRRAISCLNSQQSQRQPTRSPDEARQARETCLSSVEEFLDAV
jgi:glycosyltransferase involved in cell wall biosynthesis